MTTSQASGARLRPFKPISFGRYMLVSPIAAGGMGEIFLARLEGHRGFEKFCVIKRILPQLGADPEFVERFVNEARTLVELHHGSIAQVLDMGLQEGEPFIAIEYVDGKDLRRVASALREKGERIPIPVVLFAMSRVLDALAYAHRKRGLDEQEIGLVHRDVSPQNVLVSYEGEVKVIDFGLAKSRLNASKTHPSLILGKFLYMAPEQVKHQPVDRRTDVYAVGMCLYELLSGKNPFEGVHPAEIMSTVGSPNIPPLREVVPEVPEKLEALVQRALKQNPDERFQSADEFRGELLQRLFELDPRVGPETLSAFMRQTFAGEYQSERRLLQALRDGTLGPEPKSNGSLKPAIAETGLFQAVNGVPEPSSPRLAAAPAPAPAPAPKVEEWYAPPGKLSPKDIKHPAAPSPELAETMPAAPVILPEGESGLEDTHPRADLNAIAAARAQRQSGARKPPPERSVGRVKSAKASITGPSPTISVDDALLQPATPRAPTPVEVPVAAQPVAAPAPAPAPTVPAVAAARRDTPVSTPRGAPLPRRPTPSNPQGSRTEDIPIRRSGSWLYVAVAAGVFVLGVGSFLLLQRLRSADPMPVPASVVEIPADPTVTAEAPSEDGPPTATAEAPSENGPPTASAEVPTEAPEVVDEPTEAESVAAEVEADPNVVAASAEEPGPAEASPEEAPTPTVTRPSIPDAAALTKRTPTRTTRSGPRIDPNDPFRKEWARTRAAFEKVTRHKSCQSQALSLLCVRYRSVEREVRRASSDEEKEKAMERIRLLQDALTEKGASF